MTKLSHVAYLCLVAYAAGQTSESSVPTAFGLPSNDVPVGVEVCNPDFMVLAGLPEDLMGVPPFCMNGGSCKATFAMTPEWPCECLDGFTGPHCEFVENYVPDCTVDCFNGGECQVGIRHWNEDARPLEQKQFCACPTGYHGYLCEVEGKECGNHHCFYGGSCVQVIQDDGTMREHCDCSTAGDDDTKYAGRFCQNKATSFCNDFADHNGHQFCVNGGICKGESHLGCECPDGFVGPICEFVDKEIEHAECTLQCANNGVCRKGAKDISILQLFDVGQRGLIDEDAYSDDFEHCVCPRGFVGLRCEYQMDVCPGGSHVCLNGSECSPFRNDKGLHFECDCQVSDSMRYAGEYCEYRSTEFCTSDGLPGTGNSHGAFCVNEGSCKDFVADGEKHPGCKCDPEFRGKHCEFVAHSDSEDKLPVDPVLLILVSLAMCAVAAMLVLIALYLRKRARRSKTLVYAPRPTLENIHAFASWEQEDGVYNDSSSEDDDGSISSVDTSRASGSKKATGSDAAVRLTKEEGMVVSNDLELKEEGPREPTLVEKGEVC